MASAQDVDLPVPEINPLELERIITKQFHSQDVTHIIAAQAEFAGLFPDEDADTLIWLRLSPALSKLTCNGICYPQEWLLRYSSTALRSSGFEKFAKMLDGERYQRRIISSLLSSGHALPSGVRYVLELGPSPDYELRSEHLEALTLPKGIVQYSAVGGPTHVYNLMAGVAGGHDDACRCFKIGLQDKRNSRNAAAGDVPVNKTESAAETTCTAGTIDTTGTPNTGEQNPPPPEIRKVCIWELPLAPEFRIDDYCEVRHACNVIRLLRALAGQPLLLNSAARVYTICGLAKLFSAGGNTYFLNRLRSLVHEWFFTGTNTSIIDMLPEECFRMAWNIELPNVARAAYRILVAERAVCGAGDSSKPRTYERHKTPFGRELSGLDDDLETLLDHASEALTRRVGEIWAKLQSPDRLDLLNVPQYNRLRTIEQAVASATPRTGEAKKALVAIRKLATAYQEILLASLPSRRLPGLTPANFHDMQIEPLEKYVRGTPTLSAFFTGYNGLSETQKTLTAIYWKFVIHNMKDCFCSSTNRCGMESLAEEANTTLRKALVRDRHSGHHNLTNRLASLGVTISGRFASFVTEDPFDAYYIRGEMRQDNIAESFNSLCNRHSFTPEFELDSANPSPHLLLGLSENEFRFMPLWAGGRDDGTGAVFQDELPTAHLGPIGPGPAYHTGTTRVSTSMTADMMSTATPSVSDFGVATDDNTASQPETERTASSSFVLVHDMSRLAVRSGTDSVAAASMAKTVSSCESRAANDGVSAATGASSSIATPSRSTCASSDSSFVNVTDVVLDGDTHNDGRVLVATVAGGLEAATDQDPASLESSSNGKSYDIEYEDELEGFDSNEDYDDDDDDLDARSDVTLTLYKDKNGECHIWKVRREPT